MSIKKIKLNQINTFFTTLFLVLVLLIAVPSIINYDEKSDELNVETIQDTVIKYIIQCYASEGSYPKDLYYLEENYGLILDEEKYTYVYEVFASNVMPEVKVYIK